MRWSGIRLSLRKRVFSAVVVAVLLTTAAPGAAGISDVDVTPQAPTEGDPIHIQVSGWLPDSCWSLQGFDCGTPEAGEIALDVFAVDVWQSGDDCFTEVTLYERECDYDPLPFGHYVVTVTEHHESLRYPLPDIATVEFDVLPVSPVRELGWARIRALYR